MTKKKKDIPVRPDCVHPTHRTRFSDASSYDEICELCGLTDQVPGGPGDLQYP